MANRIGNEVGMKRELLRRSGSVEARGLGPGSPGSYAGTMVRSGGAAGAKVAVGRGKGAGRR